MLISSFTLVWVHASESFGSSLFGKNETIWRGPEYISNLFLLIFFIKKSFLLIDDFNIFSIPFRPKKRNPSHSLITSAGLEPCMPISPLFIIFSLDDIYGSPVLKVFSKVLIFETNNKDEVFVMPIIFCGFIVIELAWLILFRPSIGIEVIAKIPPIEPSICNHMFLCLQISLISLIGSMAPLTVVPRVATIANIFLFSIEHLSKDFLRSFMSILPWLSVLILTRLVVSRPITLIHLTKEEWASSLTSNTELGFVPNPALFLAAISAFRLLNVPPLAAIPPEKSLNPIFLANHLHNDSSSKVTLGDNS